MNLYNCQSLDFDNNDFTSGDENDKELLNISAHTSQCSSSDNLLQSDSNYNFNNNNNSDSDDSTNEITHISYLRRRLQQLHHRLHQYMKQNKNVKGISNLNQRIEKELITFESIEVKSNTAEASIRYLSTIMTALECEPDVVCVFPTFTTSNSNNNNNNNNNIKSQVDIVSCGGLRWIKVRAAASHRLNEFNGEINFKNNSEMNYENNSEIDWEIEWERPITRVLLQAQRRRLSFLQIPQVVILFYNSPPIKMRETLKEIGVIPVSCAELRARVKLDCNNNNNNNNNIKKLFISHWRSKEFLPHLTFNVKFICFDTTALVALCSEACFTESLEFNISALNNYRVLAEQQRREMFDPCVRGYIEPALEKYTKWFNEIDEINLTMMNEMKQRAGSNGEFNNSIINVKPIDIKWLEELVLANSSISTTTTSSSSSSSITDNAVEFFKLIESSTINKIYKERKERLSTGTNKSYPNWIITDITLAEFKWILETIAGPRELCRALKLLQCCSIVSIDRKYIDGTNNNNNNNNNIPYLTHVSILANNNNNNKQKVSLRNRIVFGLSDIVGAVVFSSNRQIINVAQEEGIELFVITHPARALIEQKVYGLERRDGPKGPPPIDN